MKKFIFVSLSFILMLCTVALMFVCEYYNMPVLGAITVLLHLFTFGVFVWTTSTDFN
jgi:hypothetical protein